MRLCKLAFIALGAVALVLASPVVNAASMAVNFYGPTGWTVEGTAGAPGYEQAYWANTNDWPDNWGITYPLLDNNGQATSAVLDLYDSEIYNPTSGTPTNDHERMMDAGIAVSSTTLQFHVSGISYSTYDVVVYFSEQMTNAIVSKFTIGSTSIYGQVAAMGYFGNDDTYVQVPSTSTSDLNENTPIGNYIVFENVTGSELTLTAEAGWCGENIYTYEPGVPRAFVSGFQIVQVPEPLTITLLGLGGGLWTVIRKRK